MSTQKESPNGINNATQNNSELIHTCPKCKSTNVRRYLYGLMRFKSEKERKEFEKKYILGGCRVSPSNPNYRCSDCGKVWK
jgi:DNA-directed RNA polymerase subunit M/transcription elongation factor TFIIS